MFKHSRILPGISIQSKKSIHLTDSDILPEIMIDTTIANVKGFLFSPVETFQQTKRDEPKAVFTYFAVLLVINSVLSAIIAAIGIDTMLAGALPGAGGIFGIFLASLIGSFFLTPHSAAIFSMVIFFILCA